MRAAISTAARKTISSLVGIVRGLWGSQSWLPPALSRRAKPPERRLQARLPAPHSSRAATKNVAHALACATRPSEDLRGLRRLHSLVAPGRRGEILVVHAKLASSWSLGGRGHLDLEQLGPLLAGDEDALALCVVSDPVEHVGLWPAVGRFQQAAHIHPRIHAARARIDTRDQVRLPHVGPYFALDIFELVQPGNRPRAVAHGDAIRFAES